MAYLTHVEPSPVKCHKMKSTTDVFMNLQTNIAFNEKVINITNTSSDADHKIPLLMNSFKVTMMKADNLQLIPRGSIIMLKILL